MHDCNAAYQNWLMWAITGDESHAKKSIEFSNAWSYTHKQETGRDVQLGRGALGIQFVSAAEIMRYTYPKWEKKDIAIGKDVPRGFLSADQGFRDLRQRQLGRRVHQ